MTNPTNPPVDVTRNTPRLGARLGQALEEIPLSDPLRWTFDRQTFGSDSRRHHILTVDDAKDNKPLFDRIYTEINCSIRAQTADLCRISLRSLVSIKYGSSVILGKSLMNVTFTETFRRTVLKWLCKTEQESKKTQCHKKKQN